nr:hypothetical protein [Duganella lactea]
MVRALLDGKKTQTRRAFSTRMIDLMYVAAHAGEVSYFVDQGFMEPNDASYVIDFCPHGQAGDRLWVRETWGVISHVLDQACNLIDWVPDRPAAAISEMPFGQGYYSGYVIYAADGSYEWAGNDDGDGEPRSAWHPSIHMPRAASRILLEIVSVRVERLKAITEADARAEGVSATGWQPSYSNPDNAGGDESMSAVDAFCELWESINGADSWVANPWVWVVEFKRVTP